MTRRSDGAEGVQAGPDTDLDTDLDADLDAVPPADPPLGPPAHSRPAPPRRRVLVVALAVGVAVAAAVAVQRAESRSEPAALDGSATATALFPALTEPAAAGTTLPDADMGTDIGISPGTERRLAVTSTATFWVARDRGDGVCLLVANTDEQLGYGGVCTPAAAAAAQGVELPAGGGPSAVLVPAGFDTGGLARRGYVEVVPGLWVDR